MWELILLIIVVALPQYDALLSNDRMMSELSSNDSIPVSELAALKDLYDTTGGDYWNWNYSTSALEDSTGIIWHQSGIPWNFSVANPNPCADHWQGILCNYTDTNQLYVSRLALPHHNMSGLIPISIGNLTNLNELILDINNLYGTIPEVIGLNLLNLTQLSLADNLLDGPIPVALGNLTQLEILSLPRNGLTGPIPSIIGNLTNLKILMLAENELTGPMPATFESLEQMRVLYLFSNPLSGTIPAYLCNMKQMEYLGIYLNNLHGTIPPCMGDYQRMVYFMLYGNQLTGTIPPELGQMPTVELMWIGENQLVGRIPDSFSNLHSLTQIITYTNQLTGPLPNDLGNLKNLLYLEVYFNHLTGTVPESLGSAPLLQQVVLHHNLLSGQLPSSLGQLQYMTDLYLGDNCFYGTIPQAFSNMESMVELFLSKNRLVGTLDGVFNASLQVNITNIQIDYNQLTGTLPAELFLLPMLNTFVAVSNCLTGAIPTAMCSSTQLASLILDGFQSAPSCRHTIFPGISKSYIVYNKHQGSIPECLFMIPSLTSLHISGNGLIGTLPDIEAVGLRLVDLKISYNVLTGTIPLAFQKIMWKYLDMSNNRFTGTLIPEFAATARNYYFIGPAQYNFTNATLNLENNRLSGHVPPTLIKLQNISVLGTNLFECDVNKHDIPYEDEDRENYECASESFNIPFYVFLGLLFVVVCISLFVLYHFNIVDNLPAVKLTMELAQKWAMEDEGLPRNFKYVSAMSDILCKISVASTVIILVVLIPWYSIASHYYGTYEHQYAWTVSAAFLTGPEVTGFGIFVYLSLMVFFVSSLAYLLLQYNRNAQACESDRMSMRQSEFRQVSEEPTPRRLRRRLFVYTVFLTVNLLVVISVNVSFVYAALYASNSLLLVAQAILSLFKLAWNSICSPFLIRLIADQVSRVTHDEDFVTIQVIVALFNNIAIPCLVVAVVSPSCFSSVFRPPSAVNSLYSYQQCETFTSSSECVHYTPTIQSTSYDPPFLYDYQCTSGLVTYYGPAFVYLALAASFATPLLKLVGRHLLLHATPGTLWHSLLSMTVPRILHPIAHIYENRDSHEKEKTEESLRESNTKSIHMRYDQITRNFYQPYFDANMFIITLVTYLGILLTFGVVFPPLALAMSVTMISVTWQGKLAVGSFLSKARELCAQKFIDIIEQECKGAVTIPKISRSIFIIICFSCSFYSLFLFDTLGDSEGVAGAYWVLIVVPLFPLLVYAVIRFFRQYPGVLMLEFDHEGDSSSTSGGGGNGLTLTPMHSTAQRSDDLTSAVAGAGGNNNALGVQDDDATYNALQA